MFRRCSSAVADTLIFRMRRLRRRERRSSATAMISTWSSSRSARRQLPDLGKLSACTWLRIRILAPEWHPAPSSLPFQLVRLPHTAGSARLYLPRRVLVSCSALSFPPRSIMPHRAPTLSHAL